MPTFSSPASSPPPTASRRRLRNCAHRIERLCCALATYFPLAFVYSLTTWAVWVAASISLNRTPTGDGAKDISVKATSLVAVIFYILLNTSYTIAVFTDPGSPLNGPSSSSRGGKYTVLPTSEPSDALTSDIQTVTVSSSGQSRYCKKCQTPKPDRTHHCSTCKRCVLKMDHHCPWLATCLGHRNYKCFVLFLVYTTLFCFACFAGSGRWVWTFFNDSRYLGDEYASVNVVMLAVISGLIGVVLAGFTGWHLWLCSRGMTTIECLEKTRYLSGVRGRVERNRIENEQHRRHPSSGNPGEEIMDRVRRAGDQLLEFHANAVPGASRYEEGEERASPAPSFTEPIPSQRYDEESANGPLYHDHPPNPAAENDTPAVRALWRTYSQAQGGPPPGGRFNYRLGVHEYESSREQQRYEEYLEDKEDEKLPNAFDLGWRRNMLAVFGPVWWLWMLPVCNSPGDGWRWEVSELWRSKKEEGDQRRAARSTAHQQEDSRGLGYDGAYEAGYPHPHPSSQPHHHYSSHSQDARNYAHSDTSLSTLTPQGRMSTRGRERAWGGRYKKDIDTSGADCEVGEFEVSGDSADEDDDDDDGRARRTGQPQRESLRREGSWERWE